MSVFGILFLLMIALSIAGLIIKAVFKTIGFFFILIPMVVILALACLFATLWGGVMYAGGNSGLAKATFLIGALLFATLILGFLLRPFRFLVRLDMTLFLFLGIAFIILAVSLSKSVLQPNAELLMLA